MADLTAPDKMPERIKAVIEADWHDGSTGRHILGGEWRAKWRAGTEYVRADLCTPAPAVAELVEARREALDSLIFAERELGARGLIPGEDHELICQRIEEVTDTIAAWEGK